MDLVDGKVYRRSELHAHFGGQEQSGISTPTKYPVVLLFAGETGHSYGYDYDGPRDDGTYWYTGEGQVGDMQLVRGNKAIIETESNQKKIHLFENVHTAHVRYRGEFAYVGHHWTEAPDANGSMRKVVVFELTRVEAEAGTVIRD